MNIKLLLLDLVGCVLLGVGLFEKFSGPQLIPEANRFPHYEIYLIVFGFLLTIPFVVSVIKNKKS